jgi:hypothetical protein
MAGITVEVKVKLTLFHFIGTPKSDVVRIMAIFLYKARENITDKNVK